MTPQGTTLMVKNTGYVPCNQIAIDDPSYLGSFYAENPLIQAATKQVHLRQPWYAFPGQNSVRVTQVMVDIMPASSNRRRPRNRCWPTWPTQCAV